MNRIGNLLEKHRVKAIFKPTKTIQYSLRSAKDPRGPLFTPGCASNSLQLRRLYVGTTKHNVNSRIAKYRRNFRYRQVLKSAEAEHILTHDNHKILFEDTLVLDTRHSQPRATHMITSTASHPLITSAAFADETSSRKTIGPLPISP